MFFFPSPSNGAAWLQRPFDTRFGIVYLSRLSLKILKTEDLFNRRIGQIFV